MTQWHTYSKSFSFRRLTAPAHSPQTWADHLKQHWFGDLAWLGQPSLDQKTYRNQLAVHMPELLPDYDPLLAAMGGTAAAAQALSEYNLRPWWPGCSVAITSRRTMLRNYDQGVGAFAGVIRHEQLSRGGWIMGTPEYGWGYLDGMNDRGLTVSLTFGGRFVTGDGFGVALVTRYLLQTCATVSEAVSALRRLPHRLPQNLLLLDRQGNSSLVCLSPDHGVATFPKRLTCTNHQPGLPVAEPVAQTLPAERDHYLQAKVQNGGLTLADMLEEPLYARAYSYCFGTLYTVEYDPAAGTAHYVWPERDLTITPQTPETDFTITLTGM